MPSISSFAHHITSHSLSLYLYLYLFLSLSREQDHGSESPDDTAQATIAAGMRAFAGGFDEGLYPVGRLNTVVYGVEGGMEDWAYGAGWDTESRVVCAPTTYGGYPAIRTDYAATVRHVALAGYRDGDSDER